LGFLANQDQTKQHSLYKNDSFYEPFKKVRLTFLDGEKGGNQDYHGFKQVMKADGPTNFWAHVCRGKGGGEGVLPSLDMSHSIWGISEKGRALQRGGGGFRAGIN
jgi:hypothetical protein